MAMKFGTKQSGVGYAQRPFKTVETFNLDGLELARVKPKRREFPLRHVFFFVLAIMSFKIFLYLDMGGAAYDKSGRVVGWHHIGKSRGLDDDPGSCIAMVCKWHPVRRLVGPGSGN